MKPPGHQSKIPSLCSEYDRVERVHYGACSVFAASRQFQRPIQSCTGKLLQPDTPTAATFLRCRRTLRNSRLARPFRSFCCGSMKKLALWCQRQLEQATTFPNVISQSSKMQIGVRSETSSQSRRLATRHPFGSLTSGCTSRLQLEATSALQHPSQTSKPKMHVCA